MRYLLVTAFFALWLWPLASLAQERLKSPLDFNLRHYGLMLAAALLGGFVSWINKVRRGELPLWGMHHLIGELATSAFAGLLMFWLCEWAGFPQFLTAAFTGVAGHMGTRAIALFEQYMATKFPGMKPPAEASKDE